MNNKIFAMGVVSCLTIGVVSYSPLVSAAETTESNQKACTYYVRGGISYNMLQKKEDYDTKKAKGIGGELGFGYNFTDNVRSDISILYSNPSYKTKDAKFAAGSAKASFLTMGVLANVYYQFNTGTEFSPYVGAGIGMQNSQQKASIKKVQIGTSTVAGTAGGIFTNKAYASGDQVTADSQIGDVKSKKYNSFLWAGRLGLSYAISDGVALDLEYNISNRKVSDKPASEKNNYMTVIDTDGKATAASTTVFKNVKKVSRLNHAVMMGVRVSF